MIISEFIGLIVSVAGSVASGDTAAKLNIFEAEKLESFADRLLKARLFLTQVELKIEDVNRPSESRKIRYVISLLRELVLE